VTVRGLISQPDEDLNRAKVNKKKGMGKIRESLQFNNYFSHRRYDYGIEEGKKEKG